MAEHGRAGCRHRSEAAVVDHHDRTDRAEGAQRGPGIVVPHGDDDGHVVRAVPLADWTGMGGAGVEQPVDERLRGGTDVGAGDDRVDRAGARRPQPKDGQGRAGDEQPATVEPAGRAVERQPHRSGRPGPDGGASALVRSSSSCAPSAAEAPVGSPSTPLGETAAMPSASSAGRIVDSGAVQPGAARSIRTFSGATARSNEVSTRPACASPSGTAGHHASTRRPSRRRMASSGRTDTTSGHAWPPRDVTAPGSPTQPARPS